MPEKMKQQICIFLTISLVFLPSWIFFGSQQVEASESQISELWYFKTEKASPEFPPPLPLKPLSQTSDLWYFKTKKLPGAPPEPPKSATGDLWYFKTKGVGPTEFGLLVEPISVSKIKISWQDLGPGYTYQLFRSESNENPDDLEKVSFVKKPPLIEITGSLEGARIIYIDRNLEPDRKYFYRILVDWE